MADQELQEQAEKMYPVKLIVIDASLTVDSNKLSREAFIHGAKWTQEQDEWISVEDRLPNVNEMVLVFMLGRIAKKPVMKVDELTQDGWRLTDAGFITHWQPLPSPPKTK